MSNIKKYSQFEQIELYYTNDSKLTDKEKEVSERWELAFSLVQKHKSKKVAVAKLIAIEKSKGEGLSVPQAYRDMKNAEELFVPLRKYSKDLLRHVLIESAVQDLKDIELRMKGEHDKNQGVQLVTDSHWLKLMDMKHKIEYRLIELSGIADEHPDMPDFSKLEVHQYNISIPEETLNMLQKVMQSGVVDATELLRQHSQEVDYEELEDEGPN